MSPQELFSNEKQIRYALAVGQHCKLKLENTFIQIRPLFSITLADFRETVDDARRRDRDRRGGVECPAETVVAMRSQKLFAMGHGH
jgi:hypothetical protein